MYKYFNFTICKTVTTFLTQFLFLLDFIKVSIFFFYIFKFFSHLGFYRILSSVLFSRVPYAIQSVLVGYLFCI